MKVLGILGGMGPQASSRFYELLIKISEEKYNVHTNDCYPHILLSSLPVPDLIQNKNDEERAVKMIEQEAKKVSRAGADFFALPCNTMHLYLQRYQDAVRKPFISMIDAVIKRVIHDGRVHVGVLGTPTTMRSMLYSLPLENNGIQVSYINENDFDEVGNTIKKIIANNVAAKNIAELYRHVSCLEEKGAEAIILGCTELPLVLTANHTKIPLYDSLRILAEECCKRIFQ